MTSGKDTEEFLTFSKLCLIQTKYAVIKSIEDIPGNKECGLSSTMQGLKRTDESTAAKRALANLSLQPECRCSWWQFLPVYANSEGD